MPNTLSLLDQLTASIKTALLPTIGTSSMLSVATKNFHRTYNITGSDKRPSPYSRYAVHVIGSRDQSQATAILTDNGATRRGPATTSQVQLGLSDLKGTTNIISQFLLTGTQGQPG